MIKTSSIVEIAGLLVQGRPVVIPTDTVYGLALAMSEGANTGILFDIKNRPVEKSIPLLVASPDDLGRYGREVPEWAWELAERYWPGALTLVCEAGEAVPVAFRAADGSVALRMPNHDLVLQLIAMLGCPLATTSANISGQPAVARLIDLDERVVEQVAGVLADPGEASEAVEAGEAGGAGGAGGAESVPSTIVSCLGEKPEVLRQGALDLSAVLADIGE